MIFNIFAFHDHHYQSNSISIQTDSVLTDLISPNKLIQFFMVPFCSFFSVHFELQSLKLSRETTSVFGEHIVY